MKHLLTLAAVACAFAIHAAPISTTLSKGRNTVSTPGEIVGIECATVAANQSVTASVIVAVTEWTNAYRTVSVPHTRYDFSLTNYDGLASVSTNALDAFNWADYATNVSWNVIVTNVPSAGVTNVVTNVISRYTRVVDERVAPVTTNIATQISDGRRIKATYATTNALGGTASDHYLKITPAQTTHFFGGRIDLECGEQDNVRILVK